MLVSPLHTLTEKSRSGYRASKVVQNLVDPHALAISELEFLHRRIRIGCSVRDRRRGFGCCIPRPNSLEGKNLTPVQDSGTRLGRLANMALQER